MSRTTAIEGMRVSVRLDRRSFLIGAAGVAGAVAVTASALPGGWRLTLGQAAPGDWAADHIFGTYPPYAHPIPYGRQLDPSAVPLERGAFDPILMI
jgi:hypothetical protein